jgi:hypothetical protein
VLSIDDFNVIIVQVSLSAVRCAKSLIVAASRGSGVLQFCAGQVLPGLIEFVAREAEKGDVSKDNVRAMALREALASLGSLVDVVPAEHRAFFFSNCMPYKMKGRLTDTGKYIGGSLLRILLPTYVLLLEPSRPTKTEAHSLAVGRLLELASRDSTAFREATETMAPTERTTLETAIRQAVQTQRDGSVRPVTAQAPTISLKSFGG